jgi:probable F420-dependent oxidoreductase
MEATTGSGGTTGDDLTFGVNIGWMHGGGPHPVEAARAAEAAGFDVVTAADHVGRTGPLVALAAAAAVTTRVRLRTYVLNHGLWNPGLLARDVATLDALSGGRVEVGLGLGYVPAEHRAVGLPFPPYPQRLENLARFVADLRRHLAEPGLDPRPVQERVPVLLAAMSPAGLDVAARHADVVGLAGGLQAKGRPPGTLTLASAAETDERAGRVHAERARLGLPPTRLDVLLQEVVVDVDPREHAECEAAGSDGLFTAEDLLDTPYLLYAPSPAEAAAELLRRSARWGIGSVCTHPMSGPALARVIAELRPVPAGRGA